MKKTLLLTLLMTFTYNINSFAAPPKQTTLGPVVAIKKTFDLNVKDCKEVFRFSRSLYKGGCEVYLFKSSRSDLFVHGPQKSFTYTGLEPNSRITVEFNTNKSGYRFDLEYKSLNRTPPRENMWYYVQRAFSDLKKKSVEIVVYQPENS